jgi:hypothetical protein
MLIYFCANGEWSPVLVAPCETNKRKKESGKRNKAGPGAWLVRIVRKIFEKYSKTEKDKKRRKKRKIQQVIYEEQDW